MLKVRDHRGNEYLANIEEDLDKVNWIIEYEDHRDTFYVVSIDDKLYAYGWWEDRYRLGEYLRKQENFERLENIHWTSIRKDGVVGIAAKQDWSNHQIFHCDELISVFQDGKWYPREDKNIPFLDVDYDKWGCACYTYAFDDVRNSLAQRTLFD